MCVVAFLVVLLFGWFPLIFWLSVLLPGFSGLDLVFSFFLVSVLFPCPYMFLGFTVLPPLFPYKLQWEGGVASQVFGMECLPDGAVLGQRLCCSYL